MIGKRYALFGKSRYTMERAVPHIEDERQVIVECRNEAGELRYATDREWLEGARRFEEAADSEGIVTAASAAAKKIGLFRSLFKGRQDVFAHGYRRKDGGIGYAPACENEWKRGVCPKCSNSKAHCAECGARTFAPLSDRAILSHIKGASESFKDVIALYPIDSDGKTSVLVADFDKDGWRDAVAAYRDAARSLEIDVAVERSRSGEGGHAWIFFEKPVEAKLARELGTIIITDAMRKAPSLGFGAYDRLIPAQDNVPDGGFGNPIALPFQGRAQRAGNSVFVDDELRPHPDQWLFLSRIKKITESQAKRIADERSPDAVCGFSQAWPGNSSGSRPTRSPASRLSRLVSALSPSDFPNPVRIVKSDMILVPEIGLTPAAEDSIRRLAAFANPEFYRAQAMHQSVYGKPRIFYFGELRDGSVALPRGCGASLIALLERVGVRHAISDERAEGRPIDVRFKGELRPDQAEAAERLLEHDDGILSAPTGFGKTVIGAYLISRIARSALIIVPKTALVSQWIEKLAAFLEIEEGKDRPLTPSGKPSKRKPCLIGQIGAGRNKPSGIVDVATFQSLVEKSPEGGREAKTLVKDYGLVICDECHHAAAPQLECVLKAVSARKVYGLSATPKRADGLDNALFMLCGPIRCKVDPKDQARRQGFERVHIPRFTQIRLPDLEPGASFNQILDKLCAHKARNALIIADVVRTLDEGRMPLVVSKRKEHARTLARGIEHSGGKARLLIGEGTPRQRREAIAETLAMAESEKDPFAIVATESYLGEGFDLPRLDALFLATPISWDGAITQQSGRLHREAKGKTAVFAYDYVDVSIPMLERMYKRRLKTYASLGYKTIVNATETAKTAEEGVFLNAGMFRTAFRKDVSSAQRSIRIAAPYASMALASALEADFASAAARGISISCTICRKKPLPDADPNRISKKGDVQFSSAIAKLEGAGCEVSFDSAVPSGLAVFDEKTVWYGSLPLLAFPKAEDCSLRFENAEIAHEVMDAAFKS